MNSLPIFLLELILSSVILGGVLSTMAVGLSLSMGVLRVMNIAHGEMIILGSYIAYFLLTNFNVDILLAIPIAFLISFVVSVCISYIWRYGIGSSFAEMGKLGTIPLLYFFGVSYCFQDILALIFTPVPKSYLPEYGLKTLGSGTFSISYIRLICFLFSVFSTIFLYLFLKRTKRGIAICAIIDDPEVASTFGIKVENQAIMAFALGCGITGVSGVLLGTIFTFNPYTGISTYLTISLCITILSGMGRDGVKKSFIGGLIIALIQNISNSLLIPSLTPAILNATLIVLITILSLRQS